MCDCLHMGPFPSLCNFPAFPVLIISVPSFLPLTGLWLLSSSCLDLQILSCAMNALLTNLAKETDHSLANTEVFIECFHFLPWNSKKPRQFWIAVLQGSYKVWSLCQVPHSCRVFLSGSAYLGISLLASRAGRDLLWYNQVALWYNPFHKLLKLKSDWVVCFPGKDSENIIPLELPSNFQPKLIHGEFYVLAVPTFSFS